MQTHDTTGKRKHVGVNDAASERLKYRPATSLPVSFIVVTPLLNSGSTVTPFLEDVSLSTSQVRLDQLLEVLWSLGSIGQAGILRNKPCSSASTAGRYANTHVSMLYIIWAEVDFRCNCIHCQADARVFLSSSEERCPICPV